MPHNEPNLDYKQVHHFHRPGDVHELTFSCYRRNPLLQDFIHCELLAASLIQALQTHRFALGAFVFMPEHVHLLVWPMNPHVAPISSFLKTLKMSSATKIKAHLTNSSPQLLKQLMIRERPGKFCFRFWQEGSGYDRNLFTPNTVQTSIDYIHSNPVKRNLCAKVIDWQWSSARQYYGEPLEDNTPRCTPIPPEFLLK
jgi:putative transposase